LHPTNLLFAHLPPGDRRSLIDACDTVPLVLGDTLFEPEAPLSHAFFPLEGCVSLIALRPGMPGIEVGMVGNEGMVGSTLALAQEHSALLVVVQGAGSALRIPAAAFRLQMAASLPLELAVKRYLGVLMRQFVGAAPCLRFHSLTPRLARWLLMTHDRAGADRFPSTHVDLSTMLGVRRAGVTVAAGDLQRLGAIRYERGVVQVLDRKLLEAAACACYRADRVAYRAGMHPAPLPGPRRRGKQGA
jgi:CRP-like cAMP-binding protein